MRTARTPNLPVEQVFKKVRLLVNDTTDKKQLPWDSARLNTEFSFFANAETSAPAPAAVRVAVADLGSRPARQAYEIVIAEDKEEYYEEFVRVYQTDPLADHIRRVLNRRKQMVAWQTVTHRNRPEDYADFAPPLPRQRPWLPRSCAARASAPDQHRVPASRRRPVR